MKIARILELHKQFKDPQGLEKNLGDSFLLKNNQIFKSIRYASAESKFIYQSSPNEDFQALPLSQLENILKSKSIPYTNNVQVLEKIVTILKDKISWDDISDGYKRNYVFHESCHAVARTLKEKANQEAVDLSSLNSQRQRCFQLLLEESFANTCELLAVIDVHDQAHKLFFEINSYTFLFERRPFLKAATANIGEAETFKFFLLIYLHSNFLRNNLNEKAFDQILKISLGKNNKTLGANEIKNLKALSKIPFTLDLRFRTTTTGLHLKLSGIDKDISELFNFDLINYIANNNDLLSYIDDLAKIVFKK